MDLQVPSGESGPEWENFIDTNNIFKLLYIFQIIESLIEDSSESKTQTVKVVFSKAKKDTTATEKNVQFAGPVSQTGTSAVESANASATAEKEGEKEPAEKEKESILKTVEEVLAQVKVKVQTETPEEDDEASVT